MCTQHHPHQNTSGLLLLIFSLFCSVSAAQDLQSFEEKTTVHMLENGWTFIIVERPVAPVFSFATYVDVGGAQEVTGITGLAHMFEHMAFKGTPKIGTTDFEAEKKALEEMEKAYQAYQNARLAPRSDTESIEQFFAAFKEKEEAAARYVVANEFDEIISRAGGVGLNAGTGADLTIYFYSLPANKTELFAYLESERFLRPVFREFYKERDVVQEERRMRYESQPTGRLVERFVNAAFTAHPYHHLPIGYMSDLQSLTITDAEQFFRTYYVPSNMVTAVVGDVESEKLIPLLEKYFSRIPAGPEPPHLRTKEPPQTAKKQVILEEASQPYYLEGYHKPAVIDADQPVYDAIDDIMSTGRTSRLYRALVRDKKLAVAVQSFSGFPGNKYPNLWAIFAVPARSIANEQVQKAIHAEIERLRSEPVTDEELQKFKTRAKANLIRSLGSNSGLAEQLTTYHTLFGDWRELFRYLERLEKVTKEDIQRVANEVFTETNRTVGMVVTK
ncbi:MAG: M16 family metallopeptidase [Acidobacteriota bacterium]